MFSVSGYGGPYSHASLRQAIAMSLQLYLESVRAFRLKPLFWYGGLFTPQGRLRGFNEELLEGKINVLNSFTPAPVPGEYVQMTTASRAAL